jgi:hypothetical protein
MRKIIDIIRTETRGELFAKVESVTSADIADLTFDTWVTVTIRHEPTRAVLVEKSSECYDAKSCEAEILVKEEFKEILEEAYSEATKVLQTIRGTHIVAESDNKHTVNQSRPWSIAPESNIADILIKRVDTAMLDVQREIVDKLAIRAYDMDVIGLIERDQLLGLCDMLSDMVIK